jgi:hypothetical protein
MTNQLVVGTTSTTQTYTTDNSGNLDMDLTATIPSGSTPIAGGVSLYNVTQSTELTIEQFRAFAPVSTGWRVSFLTAAGIHDNISVTVYVSYVSS